jgi:adenylate cyclase
MHNPPRILIADDNEDTRDILASQLAVQLYELLQAADGEEAVAIARHELPDLILLDVMMPKMDGMEVCRRLKGDASLPFMPIILITARSDTKDVILGLEAGAVELGGSRFGVSSMERPCRPPDMSNFCCLPGIAGGTPIGV